MAYSIHHHAAGFLDLEQYPIVPNPEPVFRREVREPLDVSRQIIAQLLHPIKDIRCVMFGNATQILCRTRF